MILKMFTVYDQGVEAYMQPFCCKSKGEAIRSFTETANDPNSQLYKYAPDFTLMEIGEWDDQTGLVKTHTAKITLGTALEFKENVTPFPEPKTQKA